VIVVVITRRRDSKGYFRYLKYLSSLFLSSLLLAVGALGEAHGSD
jgi:hypothetical protein